jgi:hypothetical protein
MLITTDASIFRKTKWNDYAVRFALGGAITAIAGLIAKELGPSIGGLFLVFPAIFPATATLAEKREREKKSNKGFSGVQRGRQAAATEAVGASIGSIGLMVFALTFCRHVTTWNLWTVFVIAILAWALVSGLIWFGRKRLRFSRKFKSGIRWHQD